MAKSVSYVAIHRFADTQDTTKVKGGEIAYIYDVGDAYPRPGKRVSKARIEELAGADNAPGYPLIQAVEVDDPEQEAIKRKTK